MNDTAIWLFVIGGVFLLPSLLLSRNLLSPLNVYVSSQVFSLAVAYFKLHPAMEDLRTFTWIVFWGSMLSFGLGLLAARLAHRANAGGESVPLRLKNPVWYRRSGYEYRWGLHAVLATGTFLLLLVGIAAEIRAVGTLILLSSRGAHYISTSGFPVKGAMSYLLGLSPLPAMLFLFGCFKNVNPRPWIRLYCQIMAPTTMILGFLAMPTRAYAMIPLLFLAFVWNHASFRLGLKHVFAGIVVIMALFMLVAHTKQQVVLEAKPKIVKLALKLPYMYIANNWWNLDYALNERNDQSLHPTMYGLNTLGGALRPWPVLGRIYQNPFYDNLYNEHIVKVSSLNTIAYQWDLYKDYGIFGPIGVPFLWGLLVGWLYAQMRAKSSVMLLGMYSLIGYWLVFLFNGPFWVNPNSVFWGTGVIGVLLICGIKYPWRQNGHVGSRPLLAESGIA